VNPGFMETDSTVQLNRAPFLPCSCPATFTPDVGKSLIRTERIYGSRFQQPELIGRWPLFGRTQLSLPVSVFLTCRFDPANLKAESFDLKLGLMVQPLTPV